MDWIGLLEENRIPYVTFGPNTKKGEVSVKCPWCGVDDPSEHLGIKLEGEAWGCHRNQIHRGKSPVRLLQALLGCSFSQAKLIVAQYDAADPDTLEQAIAALTEQKEPPVKATEALKLPPEAHALQPKSRFYKYLLNRGFDDPIAVATVYGLRGCTTGRWKDRILIPIYQGGKLVAWTARALQNPVNAPRYLSTSNAIKSTVFQEDELKRGRVLFITEGPFDAMKVDYYGYDSGASATAVFGTSITIDQIIILSRVSKNFKRTVILLDPDAVESTFNLSDWLPNAIIGHLPDGVKDPGDLTEDQVKNLLKEY